MTALRGWILSREKLERLIELVSILNVTAIPANLKTKEGMEKNKLELETESKSEGVPKKKQFRLSQGINQTFSYIFMISYVTFFLKMYHIFLQRS